MLLLKDWDSACLHSAHWLTDCLPACLPVPSSWIPDSTARIIRHTSLRETNRESTIHLHIPPGPPTHLLEDLGSAAHRHDVGWARLSWFLHCSSPTQIPSQRGESIQYFWILFFPRLETPFLHWKPEIEKCSLMILTQQDSGKNCQSRFFKSSGIKEPPVPFSGSTLQNWCFDFLFTNIWVPRLYTNYWVLKNWEPEGKWVYTQVDNLESKNHWFQLVEKPQWTGGFEFSYTYLRIPWAPKPGKPLRDLPGALPKDRLDHSIVPT